MLKLESSPPPKNPKKYPIITKHIFCPKLQNILDRFYPKNLNCTHPLVARFHIPAHLTTRYILDNIKILWNLLYTLDYQVPSGNLGTLGTLWIPWTTWHIFDTLKPQVPFEYIAPLGTFCIPCTTGTFWIPWTTNHLLDTLNHTLYQVTVNNSPLCNLHTPEFITNCQNLSNMSEFGQKNLSNIIAMPHDSK